MRYGRRRRNHYRFLRNTTLKRMLRKFLLLPYVQPIIIMLIMALVINLLLLTLKKEHKIPQQYELETISQFLIGDNVLNEIEIYAKKENIDKIAILTQLMVEHNLDMTEFEGKLARFKKNKENKEFEKLYEIYEAVLSDITYFPIPNNSNPVQNTYNYIDTFLAERTYGGNRYHYGTDILDDQNTRGYFPIVSMSDGVIENIGWLEKGGYRIGIRSPSGAYFYYAHLYAYVEGIEKGDEIKAGELIGFMGDTGYGKEEGTIGQFPVHLHLGISIILNNEIKEFWVNPYWILRSYEDKKVTMWY